MTDITRKRGDTYADEFIIKSKTTKLPCASTGSTSTPPVDPPKTPADDRDNLYQHTGTILDAANGRVEFAPTAMQADQVGAFYFDVQMIDGAGRKRTIEGGKYKYEQDITKD